MFGRVHIKIDSIFARRSLLLLIPIMIMTYGLDDMRLWDGDRTLNHWRGNMRCWLRSLKDCVGLGEGGDNGRRGDLYYGWGENLNNGRRLLHGDRHRGSLNRRRHLHWKDHGGRCRDGYRWQRRGARVW